MPSGMEVWVRQAAPGDVDAALELWRAARAATGIRPSAAHTARTRDRLDDEEGLLLVALDGSSVVGIALGQPGRAGDGSSVPDEVHLSMLVVHPSARRSGVGSALADAVADAAYPLGARRLTAHVHADDGLSEACYVACGLEPRDEQVLPDGERVLAYAAELDPPLRELAVREQGLRLGQLLKLAGFVETGAEGKALLAAGEVRVNGEVEVRRGRQLGDGDVVVAREQAVRVLLPPP